MVTKVVSSTDKIWNVNSEEYATSENVVDILLKNRELSCDFLNTSIKSTMPDPYTFVDMQRAVERIVKAIEKNESIAILGDYDVDGVSSTAIFVKFFQKIGVKCNYAIPDRMKDGYGLNITNIDKFRDSLIITVDNGATAIDELNYAYKNGIEIVVIDHHEMLTVPENTIVVDPFRPDDPCEYKYLCATGLVMMCVIGINRLLRQRGFYKNHPEPNLNKFMDLVALATICDVVPLIGLNRAFVQSGLKIIEKCENIGIREMMNLSPKKQQINSESVGFFFGPRLNASGRLQSAEKSLRLLTTSDKIEAANLAMELDRLNEVRKEIDQEIVMYAEQRADFSQKFVCAWGEDWHAGVIGIVAGRLKEKYNKPTIVISCKKNELCHASCRSPEHVDISKVIQSGIEQKIITSGGGHASAGGFVIAQEKIHDLVEFLKKYDFPEVQKKEIFVDCYIHERDVTEKLINNISKLEPFGECNREPLFIVNDLIISSINIIKEQHISVSFQGSSNIRGISFKTVGTKLEQILNDSIGKQVSVLGALSISSWRDRKYISLRIEDIE